MDLEFGHLPQLLYVFEYPQGWLSFTAGEKEEEDRIDWWDRSRSSPQSITLGHRGSQSVVRATASGNVVLVLLEMWPGTTGEGQLVELRYEHDHFTSHVIARYDHAPNDMLPQADGSWLVLTDHALWRTFDTGTLELVARLSNVPQYHTSLTADDSGRLYLGGNIGVLRLNPSWDTSLRYIPDLLLPQGFSFEGCSSD